MGRKTIKIDNLDVSLTDRHCRYSMKLVCGITDAEGHVAQLSDHPNTV
jgi:hypothetical protein